MEHNTIKKILIGLFFCVILFALSFLVEEKSKTASPTKENPETPMAPESTETHK
ncbi:MAG: hypothetical protein MI921_26735 [Cytophagales bacterium]|nr:hypothetical protein [Cytophagales bacterium]